jgi:hypothetical protein
MKLWGMWQAGSESNSFPCPSKFADGLEDALVHTPVVAGIVTPPHPVSACRKGAG